MTSLKTVRETLKISIVKFRAIEVDCDGSIIDDPAGVPSKKLKLDFTQIEGLDSTEIAYANELKRYVDADINEKKLIEIFVTTAKLINEKYSLKMWELLFEVTRNCMSQTTKIMKRVRMAENSITLIEEQFCQKIYHEGKKNRPMKELIEVYISSKESCKTDLKRYNGDNIWIIIYFFLKVGKLEDALSFTNENKHLLDNFEIRLKNYLENQPQTLDFDSQQAIVNCNNLYKKASYFSLGLLENEIKVDDVIETIEDLVWFKLKGAINLAKNRNT
uniref:Nuclear pore protein n=1 Tax=Biomphalaria glabrata TaxID=6526 RepID=A0A2C9L6J5_BIOGL